jgi:hypothetical protein
VADTDTTGTNAKRPYEEKIVGSSEGLEKAARESDRYQTADKKRVGG